jgi:peptidyl-prolyl cis-trans isomerase D
MTMLDRMRRHKNWLKWSLALVVLTFVVFYIPDFLNVNGTGAAPGDVIAEVEGRRITAAEFSRAYNAQVQAYRNAYGGSLNESLLRQLGIDRQILQQLIDERAALAEAERLGLGATDAEVRERIVALPAFQENGQFVGEARYKQILRLQRPPLTHTEFEDGIRRSIVLEKLRSALTDWIALSDAEVDREYRRRHEKVGLQVVALTVDRFREGVTASDQEIAAYFDGHREEFRVGEKRRIRFIAVDVQKLRERVNVSPQDVERYYNTNIEQYSTPEQVRASHILLRTEGKDEAAVRKQAEDILAKVRAGADFGALAAQYSEDEATKASGGDLDFFGRGRMVPEFDAAAFSLEPGQVSDLVRTPYGFHIIKVVEKRPASTRPLEDVRAQITEQVKWERAQQQASDLAARLESEVRRAEDFEAAARRHGLTVQESGFFLRDEPIAGLGPSPEAAAEAFLLEDGAVSGVVRTAQGYAILTVIGRQPSRLPELEEVKDKVREAVVRQKALEAARQKAAALAPTLKAATDFEAAARAAGFDALGTPEPVARGVALPGVGVSPAVEAVVFSLPAGSVSDPIATENAVAIVKVTARQEVTDEQVKSGREALRAELLAERRNRFFSAYMVKAKQRMSITINREALQRLVA